jgi:hypothetical protein
MTTSLTPVFCRFAGSVFTATGGAFPISGRLSIGLLRSNARLLAGVSHRITSTTAHAHAPLVGTRRSRAPSDLANACGWRCFRPETRSAPRPMNSLRPCARRALVAIGSSESLWCNQVHQRRRRAEPPSLHPRRARLRAISTATGILATHTIFDAQGALVTCLMVVLPRRTDDSGLVSYLVPHRPQ